MYQTNNSIPQSGSHVYDSSYPIASEINYMPGAEDDRFFLGPLLVGGLAGGAIGYGIGSNNNHNCCGGGGGYPYPMPMPMPVVPAAPAYIPQTTFAYPQQQAVTSSTAYNNNYYM